MIVSVFWDKINVEIGCCGSYDIYGIKALRWKSFLFFGYLVKFLDVLYVGDIMISDGLCIKFDDVIV